MNSPILSRYAQVDGVANDTAMTVPVVLSTEYPVDRGDYDEVLSHLPGDVDLSRANPLPMLELHDKNRLPIGVIENIHFDGRKLRGVARFSERARALFEDVVKGILRAVSVGYQILDSTKVSDRVIRFRWKPIEASIVSVGADPGAGFNRGQNMDVIRTHAESMISAKAREIAGLQAAIGLSKREVQRYSLQNAILCAMHGTGNDKSLEAECSREIEKRLKIPTGSHSVQVPLEIQMHRDLTAGGAPAGGYLVESQIFDIAPTPRASPKVVQLGARVVGPLTGNGLIPRLTAGGTITWHTDEATQTSESTPSLLSMAFTPKTASSFIEISRLALLQSESQSIVEDDVRVALRVAADLAAINGSGASGQTLGLLNTPGIGTVTGTSITWDGILEFESDVSSSNVLLNDSTFGYLSTPAVRKLLKNRERFTGAGPIWDGKSMNGYSALASMNVPTATLIAGDWSQLVIATWGALEIRVDPFTAFKSGIVGVQAIMSIDTGLRYPAAFSAATSVT